MGIVSISKLISTNTSESGLVSYFLGSFFQKYKRWRYQCSGILFFVVLFLGVSILTVNTALADTAVVWNATDWTDYDIVTIDNTQVDATLTDFPVYIDLADLSSGFWAAVNDGGTDIRVTTDDGSPVELPREVVSASTTLETGELHFKANSISSTTDTVFRVYYNGTTTDDYATSATYGAQNVWSNDYIFVYHLQETPNNDPGGYRDSSPNQTHATGTSMATSATGPLGSGQAFDGLADFIQTSGNGLRYVDDYTVSIWTNTLENGNTVQANMLWQGDVAGNCGGAEAEFHLNWGRCTAANNDVLELFVEDSSGGDLDVISADHGGANVYEGEWHYVSGTVTNANSSLAGILYFDGNVLASGSGGVADYSTWNTPMRIGRPGTSSRYYNGSLDEIRVASSTRTTSWISAEYTNQSTPTTFYSVTFSDTTAPTPNPPTFATAPNGTGTSTIAMTATTGIETISTPVEYYFAVDNTSCGANAGTGGTDSGWQTSTSYTDTGLEANQCYGYTITMRDSALNYTSTSTASTTYTEAAIPGTPTFASPGVNSATLMNDANGNPASNPTTYFAAQLFDSSPADSDWEDQYVDADGNPSATAVWLTDAELDNLVVLQLNQGTQYSVQIKARNEDGDETAWSASDNVTTEEGAVKRTRILGNVRFLSGRLQ